MLREQLQDPPPLEEVLVPRSKHRLPTKGRDQSVPVLLARRLPALWHTVTWVTTGPPQVKPKVTFAGLVPETPNVAPAVSLPGTPPVASAAPITPPKRGGSTICW